jgi:starch synthase
VVSRLTPQKGLDLLLATLPDLVANGGQLALLGSGDAALEQGYAAAARDNIGKVAAEFGYDEALAHLIIGGADVVVMPSRFEPCGLTQLYALRYGALPLVRRVGGLADTVVDASAVTLADGSATGFAFDDESPAALRDTISRAADLMPQHGIWRRMMRQAMTRNFSWDAAARQYLWLYQRMLADVGK